MSKLTTIESLLIQEIKDLYSAENQLIKALPRMAKASSSPALAQAFEKHLKETEVHADRLEQAAALLESSPRGKACKAMEGLIKEGAEAIKEEGELAIRDLALIVAAQKVEHYEIAGYGSARSLAEVLGQNEVAELLQQTLDEEGKTDKDLTSLALGLQTDALSLGST